MNDSYSESVPVPLSGGDVSMSRLYGFGGFVLAAISTAFFLLLIMGTDRETHCASRPAQGKILGCENLPLNALDRGLVKQQGIMLAAGDSGWSDAVIYIGRKQVMTRKTGMYWLLVVLCIGFVILLFLWKPLQGRYRSYRRGYLRRGQKRTTV